MRENIPIVKEDYYNVGGFAFGSLSVLIMKNYIEKLVLESQVLQKTYFLDKIPIIGNIFSIDKRFISYPLLCLYMYGLKNIAPNKMFNWIFFGSLTGAVVHEVWRKLYPYAIEEQNKPKPMTEAQKKQIQEIAGQTIFGGAAYTALKQLPEIAPKIASGYASSATGSAAAIAADQYIQKIAAETAYKEDLTTPVTKTTNTESVLQRINAMRKQKGYSDLMYNQEDMIRVYVQSYSKNPTNAINQISAVSKLTTAEVKKILEG